MPQAAMLAIPLLTAAAGAAMQISSAQQQQAQMNQQAQFQRTQAQNARTEATLRSDDIKRKANTLAGQQAAMAGAGGVDVAGSILDNLASTKANSARDIFNVNFAANNRAQAMEYSASNLEAQGAQGVTNAWIGSGVKMASALGSTAMSAFGGGDYVSVSQSKASEKWLQSLDRNPSLMQGGVV